MPTPRAAGRPSRHSLRQILDAIFYMVRSGCAWRLLAHEFPPWKSVHHHYYYFKTWRINGTWEGMHAALCVSVCKCTPQEQRSSTQRRRSGQPGGGEEQGGRWSTARIRWRQEAKGQKTSLAGRYGGFGSQSKGSQRKSAGPGGDQDATRWCQGDVPAPLTSVALDADYRGQGKGRGWVEKILGWTVDLVERPRKPAPQ